jgi:hypothetical protein
VDTDPAKGGARDGGPGEGSDIVLELYNRRVLAPVGLEATLNPASVAYWGLLCWRYEQDSECTLFALLVLVCNGLRDGIQHGFQRRPVTKDVKRDQRETQAARGCQLSTLRQIGAWPNRLSVQRVLVHQNACPPR